MIAARVSPCLPVVAALLLTFGVNLTPAHAGDCSCAADITGSPQSGEHDCLAAPDGFINTTDLLSIMLAVDSGETQPYCDGTSSLESLDLNCDGQVTEGDMDAWWCLQSGGGSECCDIGVSGGVIPATSEWGLLTMMTTILVVGTIAFNRRVKVVADINGISD